MKTLKSLQKSNSKHGLVHLLDSQQHFHLQLQQKHQQTATIVHLVSCLFKSSQMCSKYVQNHCVFKKMSNQIVLCLYPSEFCSEWNTRDLQSSSSNGIQFFSQIETIFIKSTFFISNCCPNKKRSHLNLRKRMQ